MATVQTSSLDPEYLKSAISASWKGKRGIEIDATNLAYWYDKASHPEVYSDGVERVGWNRYWETRMEASNTGSADPALANLPAIYQPTSNVPLPEPTPVPETDNEVALLMQILAELKLQTEMFKLMAAGIAQLPAQVNETFSKGVKIRF